MTAKGKINASKVQAGDRIIVRVTPTGAVWSSETKTGEGVFVARVIGKTYSNASNYGRRTQRWYQVETTAGTFEASPVQTMWLAPEDAAGIKRAYAEALAEDAERATEVVHHVTRYSREISCGATGPVRVEEIAMRVTCPECKAADYAKLTAEAERQAYAEDAARTPGRQFCRVGIHSCIPAVTLTFDNGTRRLHWCTEHAADAERYRYSADGERYAAQTAGRARNSDWREQVYRRAVEMNAATPSMFDALVSLVDEAHAEAKREDDERYAAGVIAGSRADKGAIALDLAAMVPADVDDAAAWEIYCKALPEPTDAQIADVLAEYGDPYAAARADAVDAFKNAARSIWKMRAANQTDTLAVDTIGSLRGSMRTLRDCIEIFDQLTESWQQEMRASAARDSYTVTAPYFGRRS